MIANDGSYDGKFNMVKIGQKLVMDIGYIDSRKFVVNLACSYGPSYWSIRSFCRRRRDWGKGCGLGVSLFSLLWPSPY